MSIITNGDVEGQARKMNLRSLDLNLLPVFEAIYAERSLTRAGELLNMTQPAVSNALARLRAHMNDRLFVRGKGEMVPTAAAQRLIVPVREAMARLRAGLEARSPFNPGTAERTFKVAVGDTAASAIMPALARRLQEHAPGIRIQCVQLNRVDIAREMASGTLDFAIDIPSLARPELASAPLLEDRYVCALRREHPQARRRLTLKAFLSLRCVSVSSRRTGKSLVELALSGLGERLNLALRVPHYQPAFHVIMESDLALAAPLSLARRYDVAIRELPFAVPTLSMRLFWQRDAAEDPGLRWACKQLQQHIG